MVLIIVLAGAAFLRLHMLGDKPIWYDEAVSLAHAQKPVETFLFSCRVNYKPVHFFLLHQWMSLWGEGVLGLRILSVIFGIMNVLLIYKLTRLIFDKETGLISAFFLSISVFHIFQCQQIRHFSLVTLLATLSVYCFIRYFRSSRLLDLAALTLTNVVLIHTYLTGYYIVFLEAVLALFYFRGQLLRRWIISSLLLGAWACCWLSLLDGQHIREMAWWITRPSFSAVVETVNTFSWGGPRYGLDDFYAVIRWPWLMGILSFVYLAALWLGSRRLASKKLELWLVLSWLLVPIALTMVLSCVSGVSLYAIKHMIISLPAFYVLSAAGVACLRRPWRTAVMGLVVVVNLFPLAALYACAAAPDWKESTQYVRANIQAGDAVIISSLSEVVVFMYYFDTHKRNLQNMDIYGRITADNYHNNVFMAGDNNLIMGIKQTGFGDRSLTSDDDFRRKFFDYGRLQQKPAWVMLSRWTDPGLRGVIFTVLERNSCLIGCRHFQGVEVCRFEPGRLNEK